MKNVESEACLGCYRLKKCGNRLGLAFLLVCFQIDCLGSNATRFNMIFACTD